MSIAVLNSASESKIIRWNASADSEIFRLDPGRTWSLWLPGPAFVGTTIRLLRHAYYKIPDTGEIVDRYDELYVGGAVESVIVVTNKWNYLPAVFFSGGGDCKIRSSAPETAKGILASST